MASLRFSPNARKCCIACCAPPARKRPRSALERRLKAGGIVFAIAVSLGTVAGLASATPPDFSSLTGAVDFSTVATAVLAIAALLVVPLVVKKGARFVLGMIGRG